MPQAQTISPSLGQTAAATSRLSAAELAGFTQLRASRALLSLLLNLGGLAAVLCLGHAIWDSEAISPWLLLPVCAVVATQQHGLVVLMHEAAHARLFAQRWLNEGCGRLLGIAVGIPLSGFRWIHRLHHQHAYQLQDPDRMMYGAYPRRRADLLKLLAWDMSGVWAWRGFAHFSLLPAPQRPTPSSPMSAAQRSLAHTCAAARRERWWVLAAQLALPLCLWAVWGLNAVLAFALLWWLPLLTYLQLIVRLRSLCEHAALGHDDLACTDAHAAAGASHPPAQAVPLLSARSIRTHGHWYNWLGRALLFPHHMNYHLEHHLYPAVPHYHLDALHRALAAKGGAQAVPLTDWDVALRALVRPS